MAGAMLGSGALGYTSLRGIQLSKSLLKNEGVITLAYDCVDDTNGSYEYEMYYDYEYDSEKSWMSNNAIKLKSGIVTSEEIKEGKLNVEITEQNSDKEEVSYYTQITKNGKLYGRYVTSIYFIEGESLWFSSVTTNKKIYLQRQGHATKYIVPQGENFKITTIGGDYEESANYTMELTIRLSDSEDPNYYYGKIMKERNVTGAELNSGVINEFNYDENINQLDSVWISIRVNGKHEGDIEIKYVDLEDIISSTKSIQINNETGRVSKISHDTSFEDFANSLTISDNGSVKLYDSTGTNEQSDKNIGTGMIVRVVDEYERPIVDVEAVVTGDIDGDSYIDSSDLLRLRQDLIGTKDLSGAYEEAADVTGDNEVDSSDLLMVRSHLIGTKNIE